MGPEHRHASAGSIWRSFGEEPDDSFGPVPEWLPQRRDWRHSGQLDIRCLSPLTPLLLEDHDKGSATFDIFAAFVMGARLPNQCCCCACSCAAHISKTIAT